MARILLTGPLTIYVNVTTGSDTNDGITTATALKTLNAAWHLGATAYDLQGLGATIQLAAGTYAPMSSALGWVGQAGYGGVTIQGNYANDSTVIVDGGAGDAFLFGVGSSCGVQVAIRNMTIKAGGSGIHIFGSGNGAIASNITYGNCGAAICGEHGAEIAFQNYILFLGTAYGSLAQAVTGAQFTGGESATWAIGVAGMTVSLAALFCADAKMNLGGLSTVNKTLLSGHQVGNDGGKIRTGGLTTSIPGTPGTAVGAPYNINGGFID